MCRYRKQTYLRCHCRGTTEPGMSDIQKGKHRWQHVVGPSLTTCLALIAALACQQVQLSSCATDHTSQMIGCGTHTTRHCCCVGCYIPSMCVGVLGLADPDQDWSQGRGEKSASKTPRSEPEANTDPDRDRKNKKIPCIQNATVGT